MRITHIVAALVASLTSLHAQPRSTGTNPSPGVVLPIYRDLVTRRPFTEMNYVDRCGVGSGPIRILGADTPRHEAESIVRDLDAANVQRLAERALARAAAALPGATVTVCLFPGDLSGGLSYLDGVGGVSLGGGRIKLLLHPKPGALRRVSYTVAHEYHHEVERALAGGGQRPIEIMIREGKADFFATALYPALRPPHTTPLTDAEFNQSRAAFLEYEERQASAAEFRADFMIGKNPRVLTWPGYRLGYEMVESYFKGKTPTPTEAIKVPAQTILDHFRRHSPRAAVTVADLVSRIRRADYEGDRDALAKLHEELGSLAVDGQPSAVKARVSYWLGFALWRRAFNGFAAAAPDVERDLESALGRFETARAIEPSFVDAQAGVLSCLGNLVYSRMRRSDTAGARTLMPRITTLLAEGLNSDNPRMLWVVGAQQRMMPRENGGGAEVALATYERGLQLAQGRSVPSADTLEPAWGEPELLMALAGLHLNRTPPDTLTAQRYAERALELVPYWRLLRDGLLPRIRKAKSQGQ